MSNNNGNNGGMWDENGEVIEHGAAPIELASEPTATMGLARTPDDGSTLGLMVRHAQQLQRDPSKLIARAKQIGGLLGASGFYRFPAGGSTVQGPSIDMAQALAQEWGAIVYQVRIVHSETMASGGQRVHLRASVADMRSLVCAEVDQVVVTAPAPGKFAQKIDQRERWNGMQVQSAASKIVRNAILRVLPAWYVDPGFDAAVEVGDQKALNGKSLPEARKGASEALAQMGATLVELETYLGQPIDMWAVPQIAALKDLYRDLRGNTVSIEQWRAALVERVEQSGGAPRRSALGLPASPVDENALKAEREAAAKKAKAEKSPAQGELGK